MREAIERVGVGGLGAVVGGGFENRAVALFESGGHRLVAGGIGRPGGILVGEEREFLAVDFEIGAGAGLCGIAQLEADDVEGFFPWSVGHLQRDAAARDLGGQTLGRMPHDIADQSRFLPGDIGRPILGAAQILGFGLGFRGRFRRIPGPGREVSNGQAKHESHGEKSVHSPP
jgi:hypothetical protein